jgi:tRNA-specific 2-thiouridylase
MDIRAKFQESVVDYFIRTYRAGRTPNPCMTCNPTIKFGTILSCARQLGAERLATGHYAQIKEEPKDHFHLLKGIDSEKDQSYFLARLTQHQLARACFPLGAMRKTEVKQLAGQKGLHPVTKGESQDVCFIRSRSYGEFLTNPPIGGFGFEPKPGPIEDTAGNVIGEHRGLHLFTIGQRRGINCPAPEPYYVVRLDTRRNCLIVGSKHDLQSSECKVVDVNWIGENPTSPIILKTRVRYRSKEVPSTVYPENGHTATVRFRSPQTAITPGQGAVFYREDEILGGGWIAKVHG